MFKTKQTICHIKIFNPWKFLSQNTVRWHHFLRQIEIKNSGLYSNMAVGGYL